MSQKINQLEEYLRMLIRDELKKRETELKVEDGQMIINTLMERIDRLIADRIKTHFVEISKFILNEFKVKEKK